jgi:predicted RNase H-like nuclease (RuvC/YqgF family)
MSQRDGFASGFVAGAFFGSVVGGVLGAVIASRRDVELTTEEDTELTDSQVEAKKISAKRRQMRAAENEGMGMETARRSLEDKIAQLNATIDEVRKQLGNVNGGSPQVVSDRSVTKDS